MTKKASRKKELYGVDVGASAIKVLPFGYCVATRKMWPTSDLSASVPCVDTPKRLEGKGFIKQILAAVHELVPPKAKCGFALCLPVKDHDKTIFCGPSLKLGIEHLFPIHGHAVINDGIAHLLGSYAAGAARKHQGDYLLAAFGSGIGTSAYLNSGKTTLIRAREAHFRISAKPNARTWKEVTDTNALKRYVTKQGVSVHGDIGKFCARVLDRKPQSDTAHSIRRALATYHHYVAYGLHVAINNLGLGANNDLPFMIGLSGGLCRFLNPTAIYDRILRFDKEGSWFNRNRLKVIVEPNGRRTACVGAAMAALADMAKCDVTKIKVLKKAPNK